MKEVLDFVTAIDLAARARQMLSAIDVADPCLIGLVVAVLVFFGSRMVAGQPAVKLWGLRLGAAAFLLHLGYSYFFGTVPEDKRAAVLLVRSGLVGGGVLALSWISLPLLAFVFARLRLAVAGFLAYGGYALVTAEGLNAEQLPGIALRSLLAAGLAVIVAWIVQPVWEFFVPPGTKPATPPAPPAEEPAPVARPSAEKPRRRWFRREREERPEEEKEPEEVSSIHIETRRRRDRVRLKVELNYLLIAPQIGSRLPRTQFEEFVHRYLGDHLPPEEVEENGRQLQQLLLDHRNHAAEPEKPMLTLEDVTRWFVEEQKRIDALDAPEKEHRLSSLHQEYLEKVRRLPAAPIRDVLELPRRESV